MNASIANRAAVFFLLLAVSAPALTVAQDVDKGRGVFSVPIGELRRRQGRPALSGCAILGTVTDEKKSAIPGVEIKALNQRTRISKVDHTDTRGDVVFASLAPGSYQVTATAEGFATAKAEVTVAAGRATIVNLQLEEKEVKDSTAVVVAVPEGEKRRGPKVLPTGTGARATIGAAAAAELRTSSKLPAANQGSADLSSVPTDVDVVEMTLDSDTKLQEWLNGLTQEGKRLLAIATVRDGTSLFVLARGGTKLKSSNLVLPFNGALKGETLAARIRLHPDKTFVGVHQLGDESFLMVFQYGVAVRAR